MHTFGHPCQIDEIAKICEEYNITLVEDSAEVWVPFLKITYGNFGKVVFSLF